MWRKCQGGTFLLPQLSNCHLCLVCTGLHWCGTKLCWKHFLPNQATFHKQDVIHHQVVHVALKEKVEYEMNCYLIQTFVNALDSWYSIEKVRWRIALWVANERILLFLLCKCPQLVGFSSKSSPLLLLDLVWCLRIKYGKNRINENGRYLNWHFQLFLVLFIPCIVLLHFREISVSLALTNRPEIVRPEGESTDKKELFTFVI